MTAVRRDDRAGREALVHQVDVRRGEILGLADATWRDTAVELRTRTARPVPVMRSVEEKLEHVAAGRGVAIIPLSVATFYRRPDVVTIPVDNLTPNTVCLAWVATRRSRLLHDFASLATTVDWTQRRTR